MLAKTDSDSTSLPGSSPTRSPGNCTPSGPVYYVQSPSRDSHDGEKTTNNSFHSTPAASPPHSHSNSSLGPHSRESSSTRFSGSGKTSSGRRPSKASGPAARDKSWKDHDHRRFDAIEEEESLLGMEEEGPGVPRRCLYGLAFLVAFFVLFAFFSLVLLGVSRSQKPVITIKSVRFEEFDVHAGTDGTGVATGMVSMNVTLKLLYRNRGTFFGVHVAPTPVNLFYQQIIVATGTIDRFYQGRKGERAIEVDVSGTSVPVYGGGSDLNSKEGAPIIAVGMTLDLRVRSRAYVLGRLVKPKFYKSINCPMVMDPKKMKVALSLKNNCTYI